MEFIYILAVATWLVSAALVGYAAQSKGQNGGTAMAIAIVLSPLIGFLWVIALSDKHAERRHQELVDALDGHLHDTCPCPRCAELIMKAARMCRFCQLELQPSWVEQSKPSHATQPATSYSQARQDVKLPRLPQPRGSLNFLAVLLLIAIFLIAVIGGVAQLGSSANATFTTISSSM